MSLLRKSLLIVLTLTTIQILYISPCVAIDSSSDFNLQVEEECEKNCKPKTHNRAEPQDKCYSKHEGDVCNHDHGGDIWKMQCCDWSSKDAPRTPENCVCKGNPVTGFTEEPSEEQNKDCECCMAKAEDENGSAMCHKMLSDAFKNRKKERERHKRKETGDKDYEMGMCEFLASKENPKGDANGGRGNTSVYTSAKCLCSKFEDITDDPNMSWNSKYCNCLKEVDEEFCKEYWANVNSTGQQNYSAPPTHFNARTKKHPNGKNPNTELCSEVKPPNGEKCKHVFFSCKGYY